MLDRSVAPEAKPIEKLVLPSASRLKIGSGRELFYINSDDLDVVKLDIYFDGGRWTESKPGISSFVAGLFKEGTESSSSAEIHQYFESLGAFIEVNATLDTIVISVYSLVANLEQVLVKVRELMDSATFPEEELSKYRDIQKSRLEINLEKTSFLARRKFYKLLFGDNHPYGWTISREIIETIEREQIIEHFHNYVKNSPFKVFASGYLSDNEIDLVTKYLGGDAGNEATLNEYSPATSDSGVTEDIEKAVQSTLYIGSGFINVHHPDYHKVAVVNEIIGGYFGSRLMKNLREDKGYTYGMYSRISHLRNSSIFSISADVIKEKREDALGEVRKELSRMSSERVGDDELEVVKNYLSGTLLSSLGSPFSIIQLHRFLDFHQLPSNFFQQQAEALQEIDAVQILELSAKYFDPSSMIEVAVG